LPSVCNEHDKGSRVQRFKGSRVHRSKFKEFNEP
jgi:hypothetical protein